MASYSGRKTQSYSYEDSLIKTCKIQEILWTFMPDKFSFEIEIILPHKATVKAEGTCDYVKFVAQSLCDTENPAIVNGDFVLIQFPLRTWERAMRAIPMSTKRSFTKMNNDNWYLKAHRVNKSLLLFDKIERREATEEQVTFAAEYY